MALDLEGWRDFEPTSWSAKQEAGLFNGKLVNKAKVPEYFNEYYHSAVMIYNRFKRFGFPWSGGWAEQPEYIVQLIEVFEATVSEYERYKAKKEKNKWRQRKN